MVEWYTFRCARSWAVRSPGSQRGFFYTSSGSKTIIFDIPTCERASLCNLFNLGVRGCKRVQHERETYFVFECNSEHGYFHSMNEVNVS